MALGAEAVRGLHHRDQNGRSDRTDRWNPAQQFPYFVLPAFYQEIPPRFLAQGPQGIQLLIVVFGAAPHACFADLGEPFCTVT